MTRHRIVRKIAALAWSMITISLDAHAETAVPGKGIVEGSKIFQYLVSPPQLETMFIEGRRQDLALRLQVNCQEKIQVRPKQLIPLEAIDLPDDRSNPVKGAWMVRYDLARCGDTKLYDVVLAADPAGGKPKVVAKFPGDSIASLRLIRDAIGQVVALANAKAGDAACKRIEQVIVADMRVESPPHRVVEGDRTYENVWNERWTLDVCGRPVIAMMRFVPTPRDGGADWTVSILDNEGTSP